MYRFIFLFTFDNFFLIFWVILIHDFFFYIASSAQHDTPIALNSRMLIKHKYGLGCGISQTQCIPAIWTLIRPLDPRVL